MTVEEMNHKMLKQILENQIVIIDQFSPDEAVANKKYVEGAISDTENLLQQIQES
jgi:hypothetical protein